MKEIQLKKINKIITSTCLAPILLTNRTMEERKSKILTNMRKLNLDTMIVYGDIEHGSNFEYLTGFLTRFEEALLILHKDGTCYLLLGNENYGKAKFSRIENTAINVPQFSLPNQPIGEDKNLSFYLSEAGVDKESKVGLVGWKLFTSQNDDISRLFDVPNFIVDGIKTIIPTVNLINATGAFIDPNYGARITNNANEIARFEFWSQLASSGMENAINSLKLGKSEMEIAGELNKLGQPNNVVTIVATGDRFEHANIYPTSKQVKIADHLSLTVGYKGGLSSRAGYAVGHSHQLPENQKDYLDVLAKPYYSTICNWLEYIEIGRTGADIYDYIEEIFPKSKYNWNLNPGHLIGEEEWMCTPIYKNSKALIRSGMLLQTDIIPKKEGYAGVSCESGILVADENLQNEIKKYYPQLFERFEKRREYAIQELNLNIAKEVLFMNDTVATYKPFFLSELYLIKEK